MRKQRGLAYYIPTWISNSPLDQHRRNDVPPPPKMNAAEHRHRRNGDGCWISYSMRWRGSPPRRSASPSMRRRRRLRGSSHMPQAWRSRPCQGHLRPQGLHRLRRGRRRRRALPPGRQGQARGRGPGGGSQGHRSRHLGGGRRPPGLQARAPCLRHRRARSGQDGPAGGRRARHGQRPAPEALGPPRRLPRRLRQAAGPLPAMVHAARAGKTAGRRQAPASMRAARRSVAPRPFWDHWEKQTATSMLV